MSQTSKSATKKQASDQIPENLLPFQHVSEPDATGYSDQDPSSRLDPSASVSKVEDPARVPARGTIVLFPRQGMPGTLPPTRNVTS